jgi:hypothetical protein
MSAAALGNITLTRSNYLLLLNPVRPAYNLLGCDTKRVSNTVPRFAEESIASTVTGAWHLKVENVNSATSLVANTNIAFISATIPLFNAPFSCVVNFVAVALH